MVRQSVNMDGIVAVMNSVPKFFVDTLPSKCQMARDLYDVVLTLHAVHRLSASRLQYRLTVSVPRPQYYLQMDGRGEFVFKPITEGTDQFGS